MYAPEQIQQFFKKAKGTANAPSPFSAHWSTSLHGRLALIILCDQIARCIHRGTKNAFKFDHVAKHLAREITNNSDLIKHYRHFEIVFLISPLLHSEEVSDVSLSLSIMTQLISKPASEISEEVKSFFSDNIKFAKDHLELLEKFGRYPHRNEVMGRASTNEEKEYLSNI